MCVANCFVLVEKPFLWAHHYTDVDYYNQDLKIQGKNILFYGFFSEL